MTHVVNAVFEDGVFKPEQALENLDEHSRVRLSVERLDASETDREAAWHDLQELWTAVVHSNEPLMTRDQLHERR